MVLSFSLFFTNSIYAFPNLVAGKTNKGILISNTYSDTTHGYSNVEATGDIAMGDYVWVYKPYSIAFGNKITSNGEYSIYHLFQSS